ARGVARRRRHAAGRAPARRAWRAAADLGRAARAARRRRGMTTQVRSASDVVATIERLDGCGFEQLVEELVASATAAGDRVLLREGDRTITGTALAAALERL